MSIEIKEVITVNDYKNVNPNLLTVENNDIQAAINNCYLLLDGICNHQIGLRWDITDETNENYLDETQKQLIQQAFLIQTKYILDFNLTSAYGNTQYNEGSVSGSINTPNHKLICQECLNFLAKAGVYKQVVAQKINDKPILNENCEALYSNYQYATVEYVQNYALKKNLDYTPDGRQIIYYNNNGNSVTMSFSDFKKEIEINIDDLEQAVLDLQTDNETNKDAINNIFYQISIIKSTFNQNISAISQSIQSLENRVLKLEQKTEAQSIDTIITSLRDKYAADTDLIKEQVTQDNNLTQEQKESLIINGVIQKHGTIIITSTLYTNAIEKDVEYYNAICNITTSSSEYIYDFNNVFCLSPTQQNIVFENGDKKIAKTSFNSEIIFNEKVNIDFIDNNFLYGCSLFNKELILPTNIKKIYNSFMTLTTNFNSNLTLPTELEQIGDSFLYECGNFNKELILPNTLKSIDNNFMYYCITFNKTMTLPNSLESVGNIFMHSCNNFVGSLDLQSLDADLFNSSSMTLSTNLSSADCYRLGINIEGNSKEAFMELFPNTETKPFRKLI